MRPYLWVLFCFTFCVAASAQTKAKAIAYTLTVDLDIFDPVYYEMTESEDVTLVLEVDTYFTNSKLKTVIHPITEPIDYNFPGLPLQYDLKGSGYYLIDNEKKITVQKSSNPMSQRATRRKKMIAGFKCKEYFFETTDGIRMLVYISEKLANNISPMANFPIKGTALEIITSNGLHYEAVDFSQGEVASDFFDLPPDYQLDSLPLAPINQQPR
jgi:hypothetical protein